MTAPSCLDVHGHHYPSAYVEALAENYSPFSLSRLATGRLVVRDGDGVVLTIPEELPDPHERVARMVQAGIRLQILSVSSPGVFAFPADKAVVLARIVNEQLVQYAAEADPHFLVLVTLPLPDADAAICELEYWLDHRLVVGTLICSHIRGIELDDPTLRPFWEYVAEKKPMVMVHPTSPISPGGYEAYGLSIAAGFMHEQARALSRLVMSPVVVGHPGVLDCMVITHMGGGIAVISDRLDVYWQRFIVPGQPDFPRPSETLRRIHYDMALNSRPAMLATIEAFGTERLMLGTDYPHMPYGMDGLVGEIRSLALADGDETALMTLNAERLLSTLIV